MPGKRRVYLVDDDQAVRDSLALLLEAKGYNVQGFASAVDFLAAAPSLPIGCLIVDIRMPEMDGSEAARRIRALEGGDDVKIVAVTASGLESKRDEALASGMNDYVTKPYKPAEIFDSMARHLGVRYQRIEHLGILRCFAQPHVQHDLLEARHSHRVLEAQLLLERRPDLFLILLMQSCCHRLVSLLSATVPE